MTTQDWLKGSVGFNISDLSIQTIFLNRGVVYDADATTMSEKQRDLSRADAFTIYATSSNKGSYKIQDGNSSEAVGGESFTYKENAVKTALWLYEKWGEAIPDMGATIDNGTKYW